MSIFLFFFIISPSFTFTIEKTKPSDYTINENFKLCDKSIYRIVDLNDNCVIKNNIENNNFPEIDSYLNTAEVFSIIEGSKREVLQILKEKTASREALYETKMYILAKLHDEVSGNGYECQITIQNALLTETIMGHKFPLVLTYENSKLNRYQCWALVNSKVCEGNAMK